MNRIRQKLTAIGTLIVFLSMSVAPYRSAHADGEANGGIDDPKIKKYIDLQKFHRIIVDRKSAHQAFSETKALLDERLPEGTEGTPDIETLKKLNDQLGKALKLSQKLEKCTENSETADYAFARLLEGAMEASLSPETEGAEKTSTINCNVKEGITAPTINSLNEILAGLSKRKSTSSKSFEERRKAFIDAITQREMAYAFKTYWDSRVKYGKDMYDKSLPSLDRALTEVIPDAEVKKHVTGDLLKTFSRQLSDLKGQPKSNVARHRKEMVDTMQTSINKIRSAKIQQAGHEIILAVARHNGVRGSFAHMAEENAHFFDSSIENSHSEIEELTRAQSAETAASTGENETHTVIENGIHALTKITTEKAIDLDITPEEKKHANTFLKTFYGTNIDAILRELRKQVITKSLPFNDLAGLKMIPDNPVSRTLNSKDLRAAYENRLTNVILTEWSKNRFLYTDSMQALVRDISPNPNVEVPKITGLHLNQALDEQQKAIQTAIGEMLELRQSNDSKESLKTLMKRDPGRVMQLLYDHPDMVREVCATLETIKQEKLSEEEWKKIYMWGGLGLAAVALLTGVGALGLGYFGLTGTAIVSTKIALGATVMSGAVGGVAIGDTLLDARELHHAYQNMTRLVILEAYSEGGEQGFKKAEALLEEYNQLITEAIISGALEGVGVLGIFGLLKQIKNLRHLKNEIEMLKRIKSSASAAKGKMKVPGADSGLDYTVTLPDGKKIDARLYLIEYDPELNKGHRAMLVGPDGKTLPFDVTYEPVSGSWVYKNHMGDEVVLQPPATMNHPADIANFRRRENPNLIAAGVDKPSLYEFLDIYIDTSGKRVRFKSMHPESGVGTLEDGRKIYFGTDAKKRTGWFMEKPEGQSDLIPLKRESFNISFQKGDNHIDIANTNFHRNVSSRINRADGTTPRNKTIAQTAKTQPIPQTDLRNLKNNTTDSFLDASGSKSTPKSFPDESSGDNLRPVLINFTDESSGDNLRSILPHQSVYDTDDFMNSSGSLD